ncbi:MAG: FAD:protein FMN transferase, partial [Proteobacteria bacterium]|nr:FAD:protein FMN transferase [Pseudomonadota bacterium]
MTAALHLFRYPFQAMGSPCELQVYATEGILANTLMRRVRAEVERLEQRYSRYRAGSYLSEVNRVAASGGRMEVDAEFGSFLDYADTCYRTSDGLSDVTSGVLRQVWNLRSGIVPTSDAIAAILPRIGWSRVRWRKPWVEFEPGMELDLGGIVKEYAADRVAALCAEAGCDRGLANLGGDIRVFGPHPDGSPWIVGIKHPRAEGDTAAATLPLFGGAVTTSGDYERCMIVDGRRYGHVFNPRTGWPVAHLASVTVVA